MSMVFVNSIWDDKRRCPGHNISFGLDARVQTSTLKELLALSGLYIRHCTCQQMLNQSTLVLSLIDLLSWHFSHFVLLI